MQLSTQWSQSTNEIPLKWRLWRKSKILIISLSWNIQFNFQYVWSWLNKFLNLKWTIKFHTKFYRELGRKTPFYVPFETKSWMSFRTKILGMKDKKKITLYLILISNIILILMLDHLSSNIIILPFNLHSFMFNKVIR